MFIEDNLSDDDWSRVQAKLPINPVNLPLMTGAYLASLQAIDLFTQEAVHPITTTIAKTDRQTIIVGLYYRAIGFCRSAILLNSVVHQQSLTSAERSCIEIYVDLELLHRNVIDKGAEKFSAFMDWQRLKAARRTDAFFTKNPELDTTPSKAEPHRGLIKSKGQQIEAAMLALFGLNDKQKPIRPEHWSGSNLPDRAALLDKDIELLVVEGYDMRNFSIHTGLAGIAHIDKTGFEFLCMQSLQIIGSCLLGTLRILGKEIDIYKQLPAYDNFISALDRVYVHAYADKILQNDGEPQRYFIHPGNPGPDLIARRAVEDLGKTDAK